MANKLGSYYKPFHDTKATIFASRPHVRNYHWEENIHRRSDDQITHQHGIKIKLTRYLKEKSISREQAYKLVRKKWIAITSHKNRLYVRELCSDAINEYLGIDCH
jgi:hypothetical protein